ncbi:hypothetical protein GWK47_031906 [Chionoecetes opilio]|uniref:Uncharacterized protein n=1 Tax=Chionoecetes opilio TaxID=41210 RepID=A0A8J4YJW6_CHIOP|nr:hypothetical protein GWK47_031906 [Chionoecetes opilio]
MEGVWGVMIVLVWAKYSILNALSRHVVMFEHLIAPQFRLFGPNGLTQTPQNGAVKLDIESLAMESKFTVHNPAIVGRNDKHALGCTPDLPCLPWCPGRSRRPDSSSPVISLDMKVGSPQAC